MKSVFALVSCALGLAGLAQAHMEMTSPAPFKSKANPNAGSDIDYSMTAPLAAGGGNFPCKGYHSLFGTDAGKPTAEYKAGGTYQMTITGGANHGGGSCQASLSFDKGSSWTVIHSYIGNCPAAGTSNLDFTIPPDTPSGDVIFAWTWFNKVGNREMYMNCAAVTITGGSSKRNDKRVAALSSRPALFVANVNNGCSTKEGSDLAFPNPGPDESDSSSNTSPPVGSCASSGGGSGGGGSGEVGTNPGSGDGNSGAPSSPAGGAPPATSQAPVVTSKAPVAPSQPAVTPSAPANGGSPSNVYVSPPYPTSVVNTSSPTPPSSPGGVFITVSEPADATDAPVAPTSVVNNPPVAPSSTLLTITRSAGGGSGEAPAVPTTPATPAMPSAAPSAAPSAVPTPGEGSGSNPGSGSGTANTAGTPCQKEGEWNCIGGTQFQRCASGNWSVVMNMAAGTNCNSGFASRVKRGGARYTAPWRV